MKYKSALITQGSGSVGGLTASYNSGGNYFRARVKPADPATCRQKKMRAIMSALVTSWIGLDPEERQAWNDYAANVPLTPAFCGEMAYTGQNQYVRSNAPRLQAGLSLITAAPTQYDTGVPPEDTVSVTLGPTPGVITVTQDFSTPTDETGDILIYAGIPQNPSVNFYGGPWQLAGWTSVAASSTTITSPMTVGTTYMSDYVPAPGQQMPIKARMTYADGRLSTSTQCMNPAEQLTST